VNRSFNFSKEAKRGQLMRTCFTMKEIGGRGGGDENGDRYKHGELGIFKCELSVKRQGR